MKISKENVKTILFIAFCITMLFALIWHFEGLVELLLKLFAVVRPVIVGFCIAFVFNIPMSFFERKLFGFMLRPNKKGKTHKTLARLFSVLLAILTFAAAVSLLFLFIIPQIVDTVSSIITRIPAFTQRAIEFTQNFLSRFNIDAKNVTQMLLGGEEALTEVGNFIKNNLSSVLLSATHFGTSVVSGVVTAFLGIFIATYFMFDKEKILGQIRRFFKSIISEKTFGYLAHVVEVSSKAFSNFISGQVLEALILATLCFIGMLIFGFPYPLVVSVLVGVTAIVPILGAWLGGGIAALLILIYDPVKALSFIVYFLILQQIEGNLIYPRVVGSQVGLPGVWVLLAIIIGSNVIGPVGALVAVPLASVIYVLLAEFVKKREQRNEL